MTTDPIITDTLAALRQAGWRAELAPARRALPAIIGERYPELPSLAAEFIQSVECCIRGDEACWLLTATDFEESTTDGFGWNAFEEILLEDGTGEAEIRQFWDRHMPILSSVSGDYEYVAIVTDRAASDYGKVVRGDVVDFDSPHPTARDFRDFLAQLGEVARAAPRSPAYSNYLASFVHQTIVEDSAPSFGARRLIGTLRRLFLRR